MRCHPIQRDDGRRVRFRDGRWEMSTAVAIDPAARFGNKTRLSWSGFDLIDGFWRCSQRTGTPEVRLGTNPRHRARRYSILVAIAAVAARKAAGR